MALDIQLEAGILAPPACFANEQDRLEAFVAAITATSTGDIQWHTGTTAPVTNDEYWLLVDVNGRPTDILKWSITDAAWVRILSQLHICTNATGTNSILLTMSPPFTTAAGAYLYGRTYIFTVQNANTAAVTISVDGLAAKPLVKLGGSPMESGNLAANQIIMVMSDGTSFHMLTPVTGTGGVEVATITPGNDRDFIRTAPGPVALWEAPYETEAADYLSIPAGGSAVTLTHGFSTDPVSWSIGIRCNDVGGDAGYAEGDYVPVDSIVRTNNSESDIRCSGYSNASVLGFVRIAGIPLAVNHKTTGAITAITEAKWRVVGRAIR